MSVPQRVRDNLRSIISTQLEMREIDPSTVNISRGPTGYLVASDDKGRVSGVFDVTGGGDAINFADAIVGNAQTSNTAGEGGQFESVADIQESAIRDELDKLDDIPVVVQGGGDDFDLAEVDVGDATTISVGDRVVLNDPSGTGLVFESDSDLSEFATRLSELPDRVREVVGPDDLGDAPDLREGIDERRERREAREAARDAAEAAGVDLDGFGIDARADGEVIVQDRDTGRTRTIDADAPGGVGSAIDAATGDGQFVADDADPAASGSGSGDGLGARAAGAVVLLFGALAAALGWLS